jgi:hypothetical protein
MTDIEEVKFMRIVHQWRHLKQLKQGGHGHKNGNFTSFIKYVGQSSGGCYASLMACGVVGVQHCKRALLLCHFVFVYLCEGGAAPQTWMYINSTFLLKSAN